MPEADPAQRIVDRREPDLHPQAALQLGLELGQREVGRRLDQPPQVGFVRLEHAPPVARSRCMSLMAADGLTAKRRAACRIELPCSTTPTMRSRRSIEIGAGMTTSR
jgi:hypothetical protein